MPPTVPPQVLTNTVRVVPLALALALPLALALAGCGGGSDAADPLASYRQQKLQWTACDPAALDSDTAMTAEERRMLWQQLGERLRCSQLRAPMDWAAPGGRDIAVGVMRVASAQSGERRGMLVLNPGGPGIDGLGSALALYHGLRQSNPDDPLGAQQLRLIDSHDLVGFSPRGVGSSTQLHCNTEAPKREVDEAPSGLDPSNLDNARHNYREMARACQGDPFTPHVNTEATARDLDLLREVMGEHQLNYLGYSYGTWLGAWYASLFPDHVGRMVLDSTEDFTRPHEAALLAMAPARQRVQDEVLLPYAARHAAHFQLGDSVAQIQTTLGRLGPRMRSLLAHSLGDQTYSSARADQYVDTLVAARGLDALLPALPRPADEAAAEAALRRQVFIRDDARHDEAVRAEARQLYGAYRSRFLQRPKPPADLSLTSDEATYWAVSCNDSHSTANPAAWEARIREAARSAPDFFGALTLTYPCVYWGGSSVQQPAVQALAQVPILMVQSQYDTATPAEGAARLFAQLPLARRVVVAGEYQHSLFPYQEPCVDSVVVAYLLGETPAAREMTCAARPLPQDGRTIRAHAKPAVSGAYRDPWQAAVLLERFHASLVPRSARTPAAKAHSY